MPGFGHRKRPKVGKSEAPPEMGGGKRLGGVMRAWEVGISGGPPLSQGKDCEKKGR